MSLCLKWSDYRGTHDNSPNAERVRKKEETIIESLLEPRTLLEYTSELPRSQITRENVAQDTKSGIIASTVTTDNNASVYIRPEITPKELPISNLLLRG